MSDTVEVASARLNAPTDHEGLDRLVQQLVTCDASDSQRILELAQKLAGFLHQDPRSVPYFGDSGGFLALGQVLATLQSVRDAPDSEAHDVRQPLSQTALDVLTTAIAHPTNLAAFERSLGWDRLAASLVGAVPDTDTLLVVTWLLGVGVGRVDDGARQVPAWMDHAGEVHTSPPFAVLHPHAVDAAWALGIASAPRQALVVSQLVLDLIQALPRNAIMLRHTRLPARVLEHWLLHRGRLERQILRLLWHDGISSTADMRVLIDAILTEGVDRALPVLDLVLQSATAAPQPSALTFTAAPVREKSSYACVAELPRAFPANDAALEGYTVALGFRCETVTPDGWLPLLVLGPGPHCMKLSMDMATLSLVFQPGGVSSSSHALPRTTCQRGVWHHVVLTHAYAEPGTPSTLHVYLDGQRACTLQVPWPGTMARPVALQVSGELLSSSSDSDAAATWSASFVMVHDSVLPASIPRLVYELGPLYTGNWQGPLARFLNYAAMRRMVERVDHLATASSPPRSSSAYLALHAAMFGAAADVLPLERFQIHLQAAHLVHHDSQALWLNQLCASAREAVAKPHGHAVVHGTPTWRVPCAWQDSLASVGGSAVLLKLVDKSHTATALTKTLELFASSVTNAWRLADEAERIHAYDILAVLLHEKRAMLQSAHLDSLTMFAAPHGVLEHAALFRTVILNTKLWSATSEELLLAYADHLVKVLPSTRRTMGDVSVMRRLLHWAETTPSLPVDKAIDILRATLHSHFRPRHLQALLHFIARTVGNAAPSAQQLGAAHPRTDVDLPLPPIECAEAMVPALPTPSARAFALGSALLRVLLNDARLYPNRMSMLAKAAQAKWLILLLRPGIRRDVVPDAIALVGALLESSPALAGAWTRLGGFRVLEASLPPHWDLPCVLPWLWSLIVGPKPCRESLVSSYAPSTSQPDAPLAHPQALRVLVQCLTTAITEAVPLTRPRRASFAGVFSHEKPWHLVEQSIELLRQHSKHGPLRTLLMLAPTLVCIFRATLPALADVSCGLRASKWCDDLLDMVAEGMAELILESQTLTLLKNLHAAMPTPDPWVQSRLCVRTYTLLLAHTRTLISTGPPSRRIMELVAELLELASNESMRSVELQRGMFDLAGILVRQAPAALSPHIRAQASLALERNILHAFATPDAPSPLAFCAEAKWLVLSMIADDHFVLCVLHHAWTAWATRQDADALTCLEHCAKQWPGITPWPLDHLTEAPPDNFVAAWDEAASAQAQYLHDLARERMRAWKTRPSARILSILQWHKRLSHWHATLQEHHSIREARARQDAQSDLALFRRVWTDMSHLVGTVPEESASEWHLDPIEGPGRQRRKLWAVPAHPEALQTTTPSAPPSVLPLSEQDATPLPADICVEAAALEPPALAVAVPGPETLADVSSTEAATTAQDENEDKIRHVLRSLQPGDVVEHLFNAARAVGVDVQCCLLIVSERGLYLLDDFFQRPNGEIVLAWEAPAEERDDLLLAAGLGQVDRSDEAVRHWRWDQLQLCLPRAWLHRRTALELFMDDGQSCLLVLPTPAHVARVHGALRAKVPDVYAASDAIREGLRETMAGPAPLSGMLRKPAPGPQTQAWQERKMSNAAYLMLLNTAAGRTMNDLTQFPVFPWVLADYSSAALDLENPASFRDLALPMGAQTEPRRTDFQERYDQMVQVHMEPFHYGTHYSTATTVCGFLVRMLPYARILRSLQGGSFDLPDRMFRSVGDVWASASQYSQADVRELIPEFYYLPDMFVNAQHFDFGVTQNGTQVNDVALPPWAHGDPLLFVQRHREALESDYVSAHLHEWIDLMFGVKVQGPAAVAATNVFHPMSYPHSSALTEPGHDADPESALERQVAARVIHNFGQTPAPLFHRPHPPRQARSTPPPWMATDVLDTPNTLLQGCYPITHVPGAVHCIDGPAEAPCASTRDCVLLSDAKLVLSFGHIDNSVRMVRGRTLVAMLEQAAVGRITCAGVLPSLVVLGAEDGMVELYGLHREDIRLEARASLAGHKAAVLCVTTSPAWGIAATGSADHTVVLWDLHRARYVRTLAGPDQPVRLVSIDEKQGWIAAVAGHDVWVWTINGDLVAHQSTRSAAPDRPSSLCFVARDFHRGRLGALATGHRGVWVLWSIVSQHASTDVAPRWRLQALHRYRLRNHALVTALASLHDTAVCTGDEHGDVYAWCLPGHAMVPVSAHERCVGPCGRRFSFLDTKRSCQGCGGTVCAKCLHVYYSGQLRLCGACQQALSTPGA